MGLRPSSGQSRLTGHSSGIAQGGLPEDIEDESARFDNEESTHAPGLVGQWVDDVIAPRHGIS